ncbi:hypothetical protein [Alkalicoccus chagannorensis]|uniref:hypothetical protein n=1 Tax=Alkalicoccus chagannorensis TaxID=427072 RepID=UPI0004151C6A|nr:hypothetical protein [Alkalicoccus chagannorensis]
MTRYNTPDRPVHSITLANRLIQDGYTIEFIQKEGAQIVFYFRSTFGLSQRISDHMRKVKT